jgi:iron complex outermembrane recepter protein
MNSPNLPMKFYFTRLLLLFILLTGACTIQAQVLLRGEITDAGTSEPLIGASITVKGGTEGTVTEFDGTFELRINRALPVTLVVSYVGYNDLELSVTTAAQPLKIRLESSVITTDVVEIKGQRISEKQKANPLTIESLDLIAIKQAATDNFYDGLGSLKGVDLTAASLGFKIINTRGFNSTSPVRSLQIIDGLDNQAPGLNFSLGNFLGSSELDVLKVDLVVGASSAFYGPNAFNGVISMETKNPFMHKGLSASVKVGERSMREVAFRWADALKNKNGHEVFAYKFNFSHLRAYDWEADNYDPVDDTDTGVGNPGGFDAVNIYGDEYYSGFDYSTFDLHAYPGLGTWHRTGYREKDLVDYNTQNTKAAAAFHFRTKPEQGVESPEIILSSSYGTGTTVYQGDNRFSLRGIQFLQNRIEFRKRDKFFVRAYASHEDAGNSFDPYFTALLLQDSAKRNVDWGIDYVDYWLRNVGPVIKNSEGFPELTVEFDPITFEVIARFDRQAALAWLAANNDRLTDWHGQAAAFANAANPRNNSRDFFAPGTDRFRDKLDEISMKSRNENGTRFIDRSSLYHMHGEYKFTPSFLDYWTVGGNARLYTPYSEGTIFYDTAGITITNLEVGLYTGMEKSFFDKRLKATFAMRADKNQNFNLLLSPAGSLVWKPSDNDYLRASFSSAIRNPTLSDQYLSLNVGRATLSGNLEGVDSLVTIPSLRSYLGTLDRSALEYFNIDPVRPEQVRTFELGYRTTLFDKLFVDMGYYYSIYDDFLGFNLGAKLTLDPQTGRPANVQAFRYSANSINTVTTQGFSVGLNYYFGQYFMAAGNYSWNRLNVDFEDDPIIPAFNTPEHKFNLSISGRDVPVNLGFVKFRKLGFNINYKWIDGFLFEGSPQFTGFIPSYDLVDAQINHEIKKINSIIKIGASNLLNNKQFQTYGGPRIGRLAYVSFVYEFKKQ